MSLFNKLIELHDRWLFKDSALVRPWLSLVLGVVGMAGLVLCWFVDATETKWLAAFSGFAVGVAAEKFAQAQVRRVQLKFTESEPITRR
jgi:hypothetical protein